MRFVTYFTFSALRPQNLLTAVSAASLWVWNSTTGKPWYYDRRVDKFIFWVFSWVVWEGFMQRFGGQLWLNVTLVLSKLGAFVLFLSNKVVALAPAYPKLPETGLGYQINAAFSKTAATWGLNPEKDLDLTVNTDCEDLAAFAGDVFEFIEQDRSLLLDSITDFTAAAALTLGALGTHRVLSSRLLKRK